MKVKLRSPSIDQAVLGQAKLRRNLDKLKPLCTKMDLSIEGRTKPQQFVQDLILHKIKLFFDVSAVPMNTGSLDPKLCMCTKLLSI